MAGHCCVLQIERDHHQPFRPPALKVNLCCLSCIRLASIPRALRPYCVRLGVRPPVTSIAVLASAESAQLLVRFAPTGLRQCALCIFPDLCRLCPNPAPCSLRILSALQIVGSWTALCLAAPPGFVTCSAGLICVTALVYNLWCNFKPCIHTPCCKLEDASS